MQNNRKIGSIGENYAKEYLTNNGYKIIATNYRCKAGEVDIIISDGSYIAFVEVKYRKTLTYGYPREAVSIKKQNKIRETAINYIAANNIINKDFRFDVIEILKTDANKTVIEHIKNAF